MTEHEIAEIRAVKEQRRAILSRFVELQEKWSKGSDTPYNCLAQCVNEFVDLFRAGGEFDVGEEWRAEQKARRAAAK